MVLDAFPSRMRTALIGLLAGLALSACSVGKDLPMVEGAIREFHQKLNAEQFAAIYGGSGPEMKKAAGEGDLTQLLSAVHRKLGVFQNGKGVGWKDQLVTGGHFVTVSYSSTYARGGADETFIYRIADGRPLLVGYNINSKALIVN